MTAGRRYTVIHTAYGPTPTGPDLDTHTDIARAKWAEHVTDLGYHRVGDLTVSVEPWPDDRATDIRITGHTNRPADT